MIGNFVRPKIWPFVRRRQWKFHSGSKSKYGCDQLWSSIYWLSEVDWRKHFLQLSPCDHHFVVWIKVNNVNESIAVIAEMWLVERGWTHLPKWQSHVRSSPVRVYTTDCNFYILPFWDSLADFRLRHSLYMYLHFVLRKTKDNYSRASLCLNCSLSAKSIVSIGRIKFGTTMSIRYDIILKINSNDRKFDKKTKFHVIAWVERITYIS